MAMRVVSQVLGLIVMLVFTAAIWSYYSDRRYPGARRYSTFFPRFFSGSVDGCVMWPVGFVFSLLLGIAGSPATAAALIVAQNLVNLAYMVAMHARCGQTVGKMACRVRVVDAASEGPITFAQAFMRESIPIFLSLVSGAYAVYHLYGLRPAPHEDPKVVLARVAPLFLFSGLLFLWFLLEVVTMLTNDKRRALHDYLAGTVVIRTNAIDEPPLVASA